jgi:hypothetical protein
MYTQIDNYTMYILVRTSYITGPKLTISFFKAILVLEFVNYPPLCQASPYLTAFL